MLPHPEMIYLLTEYSGFVGPIEFHSHSKASCTLSILKKIFFLTTSLHFFLPFFCPVAKTTEKPWLAVNIHFHGNQAKSNSKGGIAYKMSLGC